MCKLYMKKALAKRSRRSAPARGAAAGDAARPSNTATCGDGKVSCAHCHAKTVEKEGLGETVLLERAGQLSRRQ